MISFYINVELTNGKIKLFPKCSFVELDGYFVNIVNVNNALIEQIYCTDIKNIKMVLLED